MPLSWSYDHLGPMTLTVRDCALLLGVIAGHDPADATSSRRRVPDYLAALDEPARGLRVGVPENYYFDGLQAEVNAAVRAAAAALGEVGARVETLRVPDPEPMVAACNNVMVRAESAAIHTRILKERPGELQPAVLARLAPGLQVSAYDYIQASRLRAGFTRDFISDVFSKVDVLVAPTIPEPAPSLAEAKSGTVHDVVERMGRFSRLTRTISTLGLPALSVPCGFSAAGLPIGLQLIGRPFDEAVIMRLGHAYEQAAGWHARRPALP
jgi:aspartyl-tRNA(Asn)/glutamyl-tRNA(Gln) amidotransferase subunit A